MQSCSLYYIVILSHFIFNVRADTAIITLKVQDFWARFTKQGKLARERNSKKALMGVESSAVDLLTILKLKNTDAARSLP